MIDRIAPAGSVMTHEVKMVATIRRLIAAKPRANPTPKTAPTKVCVVDMGKPIPEARTTVAEAPRVAANPLLGVNSVILVPIVAITLYP